jgi:1-acyl-sn-glycerol-3-phosphate acyltransferase
MVFAVFSFSRLGNVLRAPVRGIGFVTRFLIKMVLILTGWLLRVEGGDTLARVTIPVIFALNHNNYFETFLVPSYLMYLTGKKVSMLIHWMFRFLPLLGWIMRRIDPVWVYNKRVRSRRLLRRKPKERTAAVDEAVTRLKAGVSIGIFPEGTRNPNPQFLLRGRRGIGEIALRTGVPVIPIGIDFPVRTRKNKIPLVGQTILKIGQPVDYNDERDQYLKLNLSANTRDPALNRLTADLAHKIVHKVMKELALLSGKKYPFGDSLKTPALR